MMIPSRGGANPLRGDDDPLRGRDDPFKGRRRFPLGRARDQARQTGTDDLATQLARAGCGVRHPEGPYHGNISAMAIARSKLTAQGQISVPAEVRRRLGVGPGSTLEWEEEDEKIVVRRAGRYTSEDVHRALFQEAPEPKTLDELKEGPRRYVKGRHARR